MAIKCTIGKFAIALLVKQPTRRPQESRRQSTALSPTVAAKSALCFAKHQKAIKCIVGKFAIALLVKQPIRRPQESRRQSTVFPDSSR